MRRFSRRCGPKPAARRRKAAFSCRKSALPAAGGSGKQAFLSGENSIFAIFCRRR